MSDLTAAQVEFLETIEDPAVAVATAEVLAAPSRAAWTVMFS